MLKERVRGKSVNCRVVEAWGWSYRSM